MNDASLKQNRFFKAVLPAFLLAVSVGQIYAFTNFSSPIAEFIGHPQSSVQLAFSLGIFFLGMGAAFFGKIVEKNIRLSTLIGTVLFLSGLFVTSFGIVNRSLPLLYLGYGVLLGTGTGIIYISPVKTMMLWFPRNKALAAAFPIISFGLGSTLSTILFKGFSVPLSHHFRLQFSGFESLEIFRVFIAFASFYAIPMLVSVFLLRKPCLPIPATSNATTPPKTFSYRNLLTTPFFLRAWLFMFLNISSGLCLIPLAKQMMKNPSVGYSETLITTIIALCGLMNGGGRFLFAFWSDRLFHRINILLWILSISAAIMMLSFWPVLIGLALLIINACYGAGFSVIPAILSDYFGMSNISKIHGAVLSAWGFAGLVGNQMALFVSEKCDLGNNGVIAMLIILYSANLLNALSMRRSSL